MKKKVEQIIAYWQTHKIAIMVSLFVGMILGAILS